MIVINTLSKTREVREIQISVVGSISNQEEINEIETVAKVFVVTERVNDLTYDLRSEIVTEPPKKPTKKPIKIQKPNKSYLHLLTVHGFN